MEVGAQCLSLPNIIQDQISIADRIIEGEVVRQESWLGPDGNIYTTNTIEVHRVFKGFAETEIEVISEGGVLGNTMQIVTPGAKFRLGAYGLIEVADDAFRGIQSLAIGFYPIDEMSGTVYRMKNVFNRDDLYELVHRSVGQSSMQMVEAAPTETVHVQRSIPQITSIEPLSITAGTKSILTISGSGFGSEQGTGFVAFRNANDGGQSFVSVPIGPHYVSWSDTEIKMYVPSTSLYSSTVAGTGEVRVINNQGDYGHSTQYLNVSYAQCEVVYSEILNETQLVGINNGGYLFQKNPALQSLMGGLPMVRHALEKWSCNTRVNFDLSEEPSEQASFANDGINLLGLSAPGQLPSYMLGRTLTTFSGCGTSNGIQWNLIEVDILMNGDMDWWTSDLHPAPNRYDLTTALLHELGHAHLLQHNSNINSPMYFQLMPGSMRRDLHPEADIAGGNYITTLSVESPWNCSNENHQFQEENGCDLSLINGLDDDVENDMLAYPNPFNDFLELKGSWSGQAKYTLVDALGRTIMAGSVTSDKQRLDTSQLPIGFYLLQIADSNIQQVFRLLKN